MSLRNLIALVLSMAFATGAFAQDADALIRYRQGVMKVIGGHMQALSTIMRGNVYADDFELHARGLAEAATVVGTIFPEGSGTGKTKALPKIWQEPNEFRKHIDEFQTAAARLAEVAKAGDRSAFGGAMQDLGKACKGCHDEFRKE